MTMNEKKTRKAPYIKRSATHKNVAGSSKRADRLLPPVDCSKGLPVEVEKRMPTVLDETAFTYDQSKTLADYLSAEQITQCNKSLLSQTPSIGHIALKVLKGSTLDLLGCTSDDEVRLTVKQILQRQDGSAKFNRMGNWNESVGLALLEKSLNVPSYLEGQRFGLDAYIIDGGACWMIDFKSSFNWGNTSSQAGLSTKFQTGREHALSLGIDDARIFPLVLNLDAATDACYQWASHNYIQLDGRLAWEFLTKDHNVVLAIRKALIELNSRLDVSPEVVSQVTEIILATNLFTRNEDGMLAGNLGYDSQDGYVLIERQ